jgi:ribonuclease Z
VGKLIIGHFSARYKTLDPLLEEARAVFPNTEMAIEGEVFRWDE